MKPLATVLLILLLGTGLPGCDHDHYEWFQKPRDMENVRRQFHLGDGATFVHFDSNPKSWRPEGLRSEAIIAFSDVAFARYLATLDSKEVWQPVELVSYSPAIGKEYARDALEWRDMPVPSAVLELARRRGLALPKASTLLSGKYFCSVLDMRVVGLWESNPSASKWQTFGEPCHAVTPESSPAVVMLGLLDTHAKRLHVALGFSG